MTVSALRTTTSKPSYDGTRMARVNMMLHNIQSLILENKLLIRVRVWVIWCLTTLLTIFQLFYDEQFYWLRKLKIAIDLPQTLSQVINK